MNCCHPHAGCERLQSLQPRCCQRTWVAVCSWTAFNVQPAQDLAQPPFFNTQPCAVRLPCMPAASLLPPPQPDLALLHSVDPVL